VARAADRTHRRAQRRLYDQVAATLAALIDALQDPRAQTAMDIYNRAATRTVGGGQRRAAQLAFAYLATLAPPVQPASVERALRGVLVDSGSAVARSPILNLWSALDEGTPVAQAKQAAGSYAGALASNDLAVAERGGLDEGARASGERIVGWRKELDPNCCDWCQQVADERVYRSADSVPFHERDRCSAAPVFAGEED
jgi:hypothetical protein